MKKGHAIVIGGSLSGILAARVLSDHFSHVTIIERDALGDDPTFPARKGVPQGHHAHFLLPGGKDILMRLFPELEAMLLQNGAVTFRSHEERWYHSGHLKLTSTDLSTSYCCSRPLLEQTLLSLLQKRTNIRIYEQCEVKGLCMSQGEIIGVSFARIGSFKTQEMLSNLVVDASGRGSRMPQWLIANGCGLVEKTEVRVDVGYATSLFRREDLSPHEWKVFLVNPVPPDDKRSGYVFTIEQDRCIVTLMGRMRDYPAGNYSDYLAFAHSLAHPGLYDAIKQSHPLGPIVTYKYANNSWHHYERLSRFPSGLLVMGDALCSFNPIYGQGMSVAAIQAVRLDTYLQQSKPLSPDLQRYISKALSLPWLLATSEDFCYPEAIGDRPYYMPPFIWYMKMLHTLSENNALIAKNLYRVVDYFSPPIILFHPAIICAVASELLHMLKNKA